MRAPRRLPEALLAALAFAALALALGPFREFSYHDDWAYAWTVRHWLETGRFQLSDWTSPSFVLQAFWGALFCVRGFSYSALRISTIAAGSAAVGLFYGLLRSDGLDRRRSALAAAALGLNPLFLPLTETFMTDVPGLALALLSVVLYGEDEGSLFRAGIAGAAAGLVRQTGFLVPVGLALERLSRRKLDARSAAALLGPPAAALASFELWLIFVHGPVWSQDVYNSRLTLARLGHPFLVAVDAFMRSGWLAIYAGLAVFPFAVSWIFDSPLAVLRDAFSGSKLRRGLVIGVLACAALLAVAAFPPPDSWLSSYGLGPVFASGAADKPGGPLRWAWAWAAAGGLGAGAFALLAGVRPAGNKTRALLWGFSPLLVWLAVGGYFSDRYLLPFAACAIALAAARPAGRAAWGAAALVGLFSVIGTLDMLNWNGAFWRASERLVELGMAPGDVAGTIAWIAERNYQPAMDELKGSRRMGDIDDKAWFELFQEHRSSVVSFSRELPPELFKPAGRVDYFCPWTLRREGVYLYLLTK